MILSDRFRFAVEYLKNELVIEAPYDTGNLALNAIRIQQIDGKYHIVIGGEVAPYAIFTNEPWSRGANPNENWVQRAIDKAMPQIRQIMSGDITQEEYERDIETQQRRIKTLMDKRIEILLEQKERI